MADRIWFVIPAAGASRRYGGDTSKAYLRVAGCSILEHSLRAVLACPGISGGVVVLAEGDKQWPRLPSSLRRRVKTVSGGVERAHSVLNGLEVLDADSNDWVLVHDAARPCLPPSDLIALISACHDDAVGGLLALPVTDTLKLADDEGRSSGGPARERVWRAQTPQMFRHGVLMRALNEALAAGRTPSDESAAVEALGLRPRLVEGSALNIKITRATDLPFVEVALALLKESS